MIPITYLQGDATVPQGEGHCIIAHVCNDIGGWGRGFVLAVTERYPLAESRYRNWYQQNDQSDPPWKLGSVQFVDVADGITIANMIGQHGIFAKQNVQPIRYDAIEECLRSLCGYSLVKEASVHMPRIGCGLAGGKWSLIEPIIERELSSKGVPVTIYDYVGTNAKAIPWQK